MAREYKKIFETDKSKPTYHFLPIQQVPLICCPECFSIKASMCSDCGTFMCTNLHKTNPKDNYEPNRFYYYDNKKGQVKEGHDPTCQKQTSAEEIAKQVVELLDKKEDKSTGTNLEKILDSIGPLKWQVTTQGPPDGVSGLPIKKSFNEILAEKSKPGPLSYKRSKGRHFRTEPFYCTPEEYSHIVRAATLPAKEKMDELVNEFIEWQTDGQTENYDYSKLMIEEVAQFLRTKEAQKSSGEGDQKPVDPISLFSETMTRLRDKDNHYECKDPDCECEASVSESECEEAKHVENVETLTENILQIQRDFLSKQAQSKS